MPASVSMSRVHGLYSICTVATGWMAWPRRRVSAEHSENPICLILPSLTFTKLYVKIFVKVKRWRLVSLAKGHVGDVQALLPTFSARPRPASSSPQGSSYRNGGYRTNRSCWHQASPGFSRKRPGSSRARSLWRYQTCRRPPSTRGRTRKMSSRRSGCSLNHFPTRPSLSPYAAEVSQKVAPSSFLHPSKDFEARSVISRTRFSEMNEGVP